MLADFAAEGLIKPDPAHTEGDWYTQHRLLRAYARALLRQHDELTAAEQRHWIYLVNLLKRVSTSRQRRGERLTTTCRRFTRSATISPRGWQAPTIPTNRTHASAP